MTRHVISGLVFSFVVAVSPTPAAADTTLTYDTVDGVQLVNLHTIRVTGILSGDGAQSVHDYTLISIFAQSSESTDYPARCERFALLAMSKPGKFQFAVQTPGNGRYTCSLNIRNPS